MSKSRFKPYKKGHFKVTDGHSLYYELYGNPDGVPVVLLHGGPGGGFRDKAKALFHKSTFNVLLFEQRGAGRSTPFASIKANTTQHLIDDINRLMDFAGFEKALFYGGSWGSTLGFAYAIQNPERVFGMVLRSSFLGNKEGIRYYIGGDIKMFQPEIWQRFINLVPKEKRKDPIGYYYQKMRSKKASDRKTYAYEWSRYEMCIAPLTPPSEKQLDKVFQEMPYESLGTLEAHYMQGRCFLPENYILKNLKTIENIPFDLIHGQYDLVCPPKHAYQLKAGLKKCTLKMTLDGHSIKSKAGLDHTKRMLNKQAKRWKREMRA